jgi:dephospho-CoA kinase
MLRVGLTGGIGSGKSSVAATLADLGAVVVDADLVAREVVEPGTPALAAIVDRFGVDLLAADGALDRPALGRIVFGDPQALRDLEAITHPAIWARTGRLIGAAPEDAVVVHDMPLLVEKQMAGEYHLVVVVGSAEQTRVDRLVAHRGMPEADARARIAAQADDVARRAAADVWLDNEGSQGELRDAVTTLWRDRLVTFERNVRHGIPAHPQQTAAGPPDPGWPADASRLLARIRYAVRDAAATLDHVGLTAVPGLPAPDVIDLQVGVSSLAVADGDAWTGALAAAGFPPIEESSRGGAEDGSRWATRTHGSADPGRAARIHVRAVGSPGWRWSLLVRDWLRAEPAAWRAAEGGPGPDLGVPPEPVEAWAAATGWLPPSG